MTRLILVRHGQTPSNVLGLLDTDLPGPGLTDLGGRQANALVDRLADERIDRIVASPLARTVATATPLAAARGLPLGRDAGLREVLAGDLEGRADHAGHRAYLDAVFGWAAGDPAARMPGDPETGAEFLARFDRAVAAAIDGVGTAVCVSHGAAIRCWASARATNVDAAYGESHGLPNTGVVALEHHGGGWRVTDWLDDRFVEDADADPTGAPID